MCSLYMLVRLLVVPSLELLGLPEDERWSFTVTQRVCVTDRMLSVIFILLSSLSQFLLVGPCKTWCVARPGGGQPADG